jgi:hypothetical protein
MSIVRPFFAGIALFSAVIAIGCAARDEPLGATADAVQWNGCPNDVPVTTANYAPPHAFLGPCFGPGDPGQADYDGAFAELVFECQRYCGQSIPECGRDAQLDELTCIDRDIGHRWGALCTCGF